jgi:dTMP kinase
MEAEHRSFHERVRKGFLELSKKYADRIVVLDASESEDIVATKAIQILLDRFSERLLQS